MRKQVVLASLLIAGLAIVAWFFPPRSKGASRLTASFTGREPGPPYRAAGFYLTNSGPQALILRQVQVQTRVADSWKTVSDTPPEFSSVLEPGSSNLNFSPCLEAGERRKIVVEWPEDRPWRVSIQYGQERRGLDALIVRMQLAWRTRSMPQWRGRVFAGSDQFEGEILDQAAE